MIKLPVNIDWPPNHSIGTKSGGVNQERKATTTISLYDVSVLNYLQTLSAVSGFLERGLSHCRDKNIDP